MRNAMSVYDRAASTVRLEQLTLTLTLTLALALTLTRAIVGIVLGRNARCLAWTKP